MATLKKTLVIGASTNPERYAYKAIQKLRLHHHPVVAVGLKEGLVADVAIERLSEVHTDVDTITLYVGPANQAVYEEYILKTAPKRVVFNPGTENLAFQNKLKNVGIEALEACTLVMLATGEY